MQSYPICSSRHLRSRASKCRQAGCNSADELPEAERRSNRRRQIESDLKKIDTRLHKLSAGATVEDFIEEALALDPDGIAGDLDPEHGNLRPGTVGSDRRTRARASASDRTGTERRAAPTMDERDPPGKPALGGGPLRTGAVIRGERSRPSRVSRASAARRVSFS